VPARNPNSRPTAEVAIPGNIRALADADRSAALAEQLRVRGELAKHLHRGLVITGFARQENIGKYLLEPPTPALFPPWAR
jgi:hypothetical protein